MKSEHILRNSVVLLLLIAAGIASRFVLVDVPNFKPIAAIALFTAFWFRSYWVAGLALIFVMQVSNTGLDQCPWQISVGVVAGLAVAALLGHRLGSKIHSTESFVAKPLASIAQVVGSALLMSVSFFLISNFSVWAMGQWYPLSFSGFIHCFAAAIPFLKYTVCGDLFFTTAMFSVWYVLESSFVFRTEVSTLTK